MEDNAGLSYSRCKYAANACTLLMMGTGVIALCIIAIFSALGLSANSLNSTFTPGVALEFFICGLAFYVLQNEKPSRISITLGVFLGLVVFISTGMMAIESLFRVGYLNLNIAIAGFFNIKESFSMVINFALVGASIFMLILSNRSGRSLVVVAIGIFTVAILSMFQRTYLVNPDFYLAKLTYISIPAIILFVLCSFFLIMINPENIFMKIIFSDRSIGKYLRNILTYIMFVPIVFSFIENLAEVYFQIDPDFGDSVLTTASTVFLMIIALFGAKIIYEEKKKKEHSEKALKYITYNDVFLNVLNHPGFVKALEEAISEPDSGRVAILKLHLSQFDLINHVEGFEAANQMLSELVVRYKKVNKAIVGHLAHDQFGFILKNINSIEIVSSIAETLLELTIEPFIVNSREVALGASIGISIYPEDGKTSEALLDGAYAALIQARKQAGNAFQYCMPSLIYELAERMEIENALQSAVSGNQLKLYFQPQMNLKTGKFSGAESLLRWVHPKRGIVSPALFIPIAEKTNLIIPIGEWIIREAFHLVSEGWPYFSGTADYHDVVLAVNVSPIQFGAKHAIFSVFAECLRDYGVSSDRIEIEITESLFMQNTQGNLKSLSDFKKAGFKIAMDDFGTGYSSFSYLSQIPFDKIKIDKSFIDRITGNENDFKVVKAIIAMAHELGKEVLAEGIENEEQLRLLKEMGCDYIQGNYYSPALSLEEFKLFVAGRREKENH